MRRFIAAVILLSATPLAAATPANPAGPTPAERYWHGQLQRAAESGRVWSPSEDARRILRHTAWAPLVDAWASALAVSGRPGQQARVLERLVRLLPMDPAPRVRLARVYEALRFPRRALSAYGAAISLAPGEGEAGEARLGAARIQVKRGRPDEALALLEGVDSPLTWPVRASALLALDRPVQAAQALEEALRQGGTPRLTAWAGRIYARARQLERAEALLREAVRRGGGDGAVAVLRQVVATRALVRAGCARGGLPGQPDMIALVGRQFRSEGWAPEDAWPAVHRLMHAPGKRAELVEMASRCSRLGQASGKHPALALSPSAAR